MSHAATVTITKQQLGQIQETLQRSLRKLDRPAGASPTREIDQSAVGRLSRIEALQSQGFTRNLEARERTHQDEVLQALKRIEEGRFGTCTGCGDAIQVERLLIFPETRTCATC